VVGHCAASGSACAVNAQGEAACICSCDSSQDCDDGCACDPSCITPGMDGGTDGAVDGETGMPTGSCETASDLFDENSCGPGMACDIVDFFAGTAGSRPSGPVGVFGVHTTVRRGKPAAPG
jgi:hypothetical protein